ncbi:MAG: protein-L-isoaspartate O-methyltransferase [Candidatus Bathyarchaeota archaeon]|nr:MAG: protein-L-isoaspartate O-methyltransferase [Candidatus Bathyarchaeota archaeon]
MSVPDHGRLREEMVRRYVRQGHLVSTKLAESMRRVPRELFVEAKFAHLAYSDRPIPIPHSTGDWTPQASQYPLFYEPLDIRQGDVLLEVGTGSGYGAALAREMVGPGGRVVTMEVDGEAYRFTRRCLAEAGYTDVVVVNEDGYNGFPELAPFDKICVTVACENISGDLLQQLERPGRLIAPIGSSTGIRGQGLTLFKKDEDGEVTKETLGTVICSPLLGHERG